MQLDLTTEKNEKDLTIQLSGELNTLTAPSLSELIKKELEGVERLTLDFGECDYVSSSGLRILMATYKKMKNKNGSMKLTNVGENFMDVLSNTNLDAVFDITRRDQ